VLADLSEWRWAPTFVFADQQAAEIHWETLRKIAAFRNGKTKAEIWLLTSPSMVAKGVAGTNGEAFAARVDALYGTRDWRRVQLARGHAAISAEDYRDEMVNLQRWRLERDLGYAMTARIRCGCRAGCPFTTWSSRPTIQSATRS